MSGIANIASEVKFGKGAQFWVYISPQSETSKKGKGWSVILSQGNWKGTITSEDPMKQLQTPNLSGEFDIEISELDFSTNPPGKVAIPPKAPSTNKIGCNKNCALMVGIVVDENVKLGGTNARFWTTWDAMCSMYN